jgi:hypothetical protein
MAVTEFQSSLDRALARWGRPATLQRLNAGVVTMSLVDIPVFLRGYRADEIFEGSGINQGDSSVVMSMTDLTWAGGAPRPGDRMIVAGKTRSVQSAALRPLDEGYDIQVR